MALLPAPLHLCHAFCLVCRKFVWGNYGYTILVIICHIAAEKKLSDKTFNVPSYFYKNVRPCAAWRAASSASGVTRHPIYFKNIVKTHSQHGYISHNTGNNNVFTTSLLRRLQGRPSPAEAPPIGQIHPFSKIAITFEPLKGLWCPSGFKKFLITMT